MTDRIPQIGADPDITSGHTHQARILRNKDWLDLQRLRYHVEHTPLAIIEWGPGMRLTRWSGEAERIFGWKAEEVLGKGMEDFHWIYQGDKSQVADVAADLMTGTNPRRFSANRNYRKDGSVIHCEWYNSSLLDEAGKLHSVLSLVLDVTERKQAEHALRHREREFAAMFEQATVGMSQSDPKTTRILRVNKAFADMLGYSKEELAQMTFVDITFPDDRERDYQEGYASFRTGIRDRGEIEKRYVRKDGTVFWAHVSGSLIRRDDGTPAYITAVIQDIDARRRAEYELQKVNSELERLVDERTSEIAALADQLRKLASELTLAEQRERQRIAKVLHDQIQQMLVAAKLQAAVLENPQRHGETNASAHIVSDLIDQAISASRNLTTELNPPVLSDAGFGPALQWLARNFLEKQGLIVEVEFDPSGEPRDEDVRMFLFDAVREMLFNVVKHSGVQKAKVKCLRGKDDQLRVTVSDEGNGFNPKRLQTGERSEGFGLFSVQQRLRHLGGRLEINSIPGQGTRITIIAPPQPKAQQLPLIVVQHGQSTLSVSTQSNTDKIRVILADDHHIIRQGLAGLLRSESDIEVVGEASNGAQAINLARTLQPDVVVMDISMPVLNGVEATAEIHREFPGIKVIGLSMHEEGEMSSAIRQAGAVAYVTKGGQPEALVAAIRKVSGTRWSASVKTGF